MLLTSGQNKLRRFIESLFNVYIMATHRTVDLLRILTSGTKEKQNSWDNFHGRKSHYRMIVCILENVGSNFSYLASDASVRMATTAIILNLQLAKL